MTRWRQENEHPVRRRLIDISNKALNPFGPTIDRVPAGPLDRVSCGDGHDRIDALSSQVVASDCEGARFLGAATTVALRPTARPDGALVYDVPCPAAKYFGRLVSVCAGTLTLTGSADRTVLGSAPFSVKGGARADVAIKPTAPMPRGALVGVEINGALDGYSRALTGSPASSSSTSAGRSCSDRSSAVGRSSLPGRPSNGCVRSPATREPREGRAVRRMTAAEGTAQGQHTTSLV